MLLDCDRFIDLSIRVNVIEASIVTIKEDANFLQAVSSGLRIAEPGVDNKKDKNGDVDEIVLPGYGVESNGVHESIDSGTSHSKEPLEGDTARTETVGPDLSGIGSTEGCSEGKGSVRVDYVMLDLDRRLQGNVVASVENEQEGNHSQTNWGL